MSLFSRLYNVVRANLGGSGEEPVGDPGSRFDGEKTADQTGFDDAVTDTRDPRPRSRPVFAFHTPATFREWLKHDTSLRNRLHDIPGLPPQGLRECQIRAISNLEDSFRHNRPKALIQMATGSGKTFTAITFVYRLLKFADAKRVLFLVDTKNLGEQAEQEFMAYTPNDDNRKFTELYNVQRLKSSSWQNTTLECRKPSLITVRLQAGNVVDAICKGICAIRPITFS